MWRRLGPQVLKLLWCRLAAEYLVAVRVATEARYYVAGSLRLRNSELCPRPEVGRRVGSFLLSVANAALVEGEVLRVTKRKPEEHPLHGPQLAVRDKVYPPTKRIAESTTSAQASQEPERALISPTRRLCFLVPSVTTPLYLKLVSRTVRPP